MELLVIRLWKYIKISFGICSLSCVLFIMSSCQHGSCRQTGKEKITAQENNEDQTVKGLRSDTVITEDTAVSILDSLDIRLVLLHDPVFIGSPKRIDMKIVNNSDYIVLTGSSNYSNTITRFEFGFWEALPVFEKMIRTDEGIEIRPKTERVFVTEFDFLDLNLAKGRYYRIEKKISVVEEGKNSEIVRDNPILRGERTLKTIKFVVK